MCYQTDLTGIYVHPCEHSVSAVKQLVSTIPYYGFTKIFVVELNHNTHERKQFIFNGKGSNVLWSEPLVKSTEIGYQGWAIESQNKVKISQAQEYRQSFAMVLILSYLAG